MAMSDYRQQQEMEQERMAHNLECLKRIQEAGLDDVALEVAREFGLSREWERFSTERKVA